jgi:hypothetical protein
MDTDTTADTLVDQLYSDIYDWAEEEITENIIRFCQPKFLDEVTQNAIVHFTQLIEYIELSTHFSGLHQEKSKPKSKPKGGTKPSASNSSDDDSECSSTGQHELISLPQLVFDAMDAVMHDYKIPPYQRYEETDDDSDIMDADKVAEILARLSAIKYPAQRSPEWYASRMLLFSASAIHKLFSTLAQYNSLIYEKCAPQVAPSLMEPSKPLQCSSGPGEAVDARSWGVKYEPLSAALYEHLNPGTKVRSDYGCIRHLTCECIGASPDGINISIERPDKYGRMVEIKNIVNREITGIPKQEYWIQMQFQMEVCQLKTCDFVETRFVEYHSEADFYADVDDDTTKGVILYFVPLVVNPYSSVIMLEEGSVLPGLAMACPSEYVYMPFYVRNEKWAIQAYIAEQMALRATTHTLQTTTYWCLDEYSCIVVDHNQAWIQAAIPIVEQAWKIVEAERLTGAEHRAPKRRAPPTIKCLV